MNHKDRLRKLAFIGVCFGLIASPATFADEDDGDWEAEVRAADTASGEADGSPDDELDTEA